MCDQLWPVALIIQVLKAGNVSYQLYIYIYITSAFWILHSMMTHSNQDEDEGADSERKASNLDAKRKEEVN